MTRQEQLAMLKQDLQRPASFTAQDPYLESLLTVAAEEIAREGIVLTDSIPDGMLCVSYAAFLYRKRADSEFSMPRHLRWTLNQRQLRRKEESYAP